MDFKKWMFPDMPESATFEGWDEWDAIAKQSKLKWLLADTIPTWYSMTFVHPYEQAVSKFKNKYIRKHTQINITSLKKGEWYDSDTRLLHGMFQLLVDFVELEKAHMQIVLCEKNTTWRMRSPKYRSPSMGIKYLDWEISLSKEEGGLNQAKNAKQIKALYLWWIARSSRVEPMDVKGSMGMSTNEFYDSSADEYKNTEKVTSMFVQIDRKKDKEPELYESVNKACNDAEKKYEKEDEQMLIKLVKVRKSLWT